MKIVMIGAGRVATHLAHALHGHAHEIVQVLSRTAASAARLASHLGCGYTTDSKALLPADAYIVSTSDAAVSNIAQQLGQRPHQAVVLHTSGSLAMQTLSPSGEHIGVLYPFQTFSLNHAVDFSQIPLLLSWSSPRAQAVVETLASALGGKTYAATDAQRQQLHLSAVFACNFTNHCYALAEAMLERAQLPYDLLHPLIRETANKACQMPPHLAQTGPAIRRDENIIAQHDNMLRDTQRLQTLYRQMTESIQHLDHTNRQRKDNTR